MPQFKLEERLALVFLDELHLQILELVAKGHTSKEVSRKLSVTVGTVDANLGRIRSTLRASNTTHAVAIAVRNGIIS